MMYLLWIIPIIQSALATLDPALDQIEFFRLQHADPIGIMTTSNGAPIAYNEASSTLNTKLIHNQYFMESISHFVRERIPERVVHGKGSGAFGYFEVTQDVTDLCKADFLSKIGKQTPVAVRFSPAVGERGISELNRDFRGFAVKFYTLEGNFDIPGFNTEMYFYKDPLKFGTFVHAARRNPATNLLDPIALWDTLTLNPEALHMFFLLFSDRGIPANYKNMPGFGIHLYQVESKSGKRSYFKFHFIPDAGIKALTTAEARNISVTQPDYFTKVLYTDVSNGDFPTWTVSVQILTDDDVKKLGPRSCDVTRSISITDYPLHEIGKLVLNRMPSNFFAEMEQLAYCPGNVVPGIVGGIDKVFESRRLSYKDAHLYRLGANVDKIPVNCPFRVKTFSYDRDGVSPVNDNGEDAPNYYPNSFNGPYPSSENKTDLVEIEEIDDPDNFDQIAELYLSFPEDEKVRFFENVVGSLSQVPEDIQQRTIKIFTTINEDLGSRLTQELLAAASSTSS